MKQAKGDFPEDALDKKGTEAEDVSEKRPLYKSLWDNLPAGIVILEEDRIVYANTKTYSFLGITPEYLQSKERHSVFDFLLPETREKFMARYHEIVKSGNPSGSEECDIRTLQGEAKVIQCSAAPIIFSGKNCMQLVFHDITESKKNLLSSEQKFRMLATNARDVIYKYIFHPVPKYDYISPSIEEVSGYTPDDFYADPMLGYKIIHPEDFKQVENSSKIISRGQTFTKATEAPIVLRWIRKDGRAIWTETRNRPIRNDEGKIVAMEGISRDITETKENEDRLRDAVAEATYAEQVIKESEKRYRELFENSVAGVFRTTLSGKILDCNASYEKIFGFSKEEIIQKGVQSFYFSPEDRATYIEQLKKQGVVKNLQLRLRKKSGGEVYVLVNAMLTPNEILSESIIEGTVLDITGYIKASTALQESERALSTLMNNLPGMAYRCRYDSEWTMLFVSNGCKDLTGYNAEELLENKKRSFSSIVHPDDNGVGSIQIKQALRDKNNFEIEYRIIHADGKPRWVWEKGEGIFDDKGEVLFIEGFITDVTERKSFELVQEDNRRMYKNLIESSPEGLFVHDLAGNILFTNEKAVRLMGADGQGEFIGKNVLSFSLAEDAHLIKKRKHSLLKGEDLGYLESRVRKKDGSVIEIETKPILIDFQGEKAALVFVRDLAYHRQLEKEMLRAEFAEETNLMLQEEIAERKNSERMLRETQKYTRLLIDSSLDMICASDKEGLVTEFNAAAQKSFGYTPEEVLGKHVGMLYANPVDRERIAEQHLYKTGAFSGEVPNKKKNGEIFQTFLSASVLKNDKGEVIGAMGVSRDITEFKKNEERIRESEDRYRAIYRQAFVGIALVDLNGKFLQVNQKLSEMFGYSEEELLRFNSREITHPEDTEVGLKEKDRLIEGKIENYAAEKRYISKKGNEIHTNLLVSLVRDTKGKPLHTVAVYEDITERKKKEDRIQQSLKEKEVLLKEVHHRVKNNLQVITSILSLQSAYVKDENTLMMLRESQDRIKSMAFIHESLYQTKDFSNVNFSEYVVNLAKNLLRSYDITGRKVELVSEVENVQLNLDQSIPCGLIINELVSNALKYAFRKKKKGIITLRIKEKDEKVSIVLADDGDGMPKGFDYRNTDSLGLQLVVTLTEQLNGTIKLDRKKGTKFTVSFQKMFKKRI